MATKDFPIIDAHIHLYPESEVKTIAWCKEGHPLATQQSLKQYKEAIADAPLKGFIFLEADRKHDLEAGAKDGSGWEYPLMEVSWLKRIITGQPKEGEGHTAEDASLCKAFVPWAPLPSGPEVMEKYIELVKKEAGESWPKVRGFRYLLQDKPNGTMLQDKFIESLRLLGRKGYVFDLGIDQHNRGRTQLEEVVEMIDRAHDGVPEEEKVTFIINHMCKPDLTVYNTQTDTSYRAWRTAMFTLSKASKTYLKLSGAFPEMTDSLKQRGFKDIFEALMPWLTIIMATFGAERTMFGSDWPVCTVGVDKDPQAREGEPEGAWSKWKRVVGRLCDMGSLEEERQRMLWGGTALKAYGIEQ
ncbi:amidohydrolase [Xylariomycetidae sp. FL0641]|nr:amidohydrolase [Xylariomycetidae sp. FL0641]